MGERESVSSFFNSPFDPIYAFPNEHDSLICIPTIETSIIYITMEERNLRDVSIVLLHNF